MARHYSDEEKQAALDKLDENDGNIANTARELTIPSSTLRGWRDRNKEIELSDALFAVAQHIVERMDDDDPSLSLQQMSTALRVVLDQYQSLKQQEADDAEHSDATQRMQIIVQGVTTSDESDTNDP